MRTRRGRTIHRKMINKCIYDVDLTNEIGKRYGPNVQNRGHGGSNDSIIFRTGDKIYSSLQPENTRNTAPFPYDASAIHLETLEALQLLTNCQEESLSSSFCLASCERLRSP